MRPNGRDFTPVERRMQEDSYETSFGGGRHAKPPSTPYLDDSPLWWKALLLPPLVVFLAAALSALTVWDWLRKITGL